MHSFKEFTLWFRAQNELPRRKQRGILKSIEHSKGWGLACLWRIKILQILLNWQGCCLVRSGMSRLSVNSITDRKRKPVKVYLQAGRFRKLALITERSEPVS